LANVTITPAALTVSGLSGTARTYNATTVDALSGTGTLVGLFGAQTLTLASTSGTLASANAGSEALTSSLTLANGSGLASNYVLTQPTLANVTITPAPVTVNGLAGSARTYNATAVDALSGTGSLSGLFNGETLTLGSITNGALASANAGSESVTTAITLANGTGLASNYVLTQPTLANVTITPAPLTVTGLSGTARTYNATTVDALSGTGSLLGLFNSETLTLASTNGTLASANAGTEAVTTALTLVSGTGLASNYVLTQPTLANITITPAALTVNGLSGTARTYNASAVDALSGTGTLVGLFGAQTLTLGGIANGALASANAGSEALTSALTLANGTGLASNYVLTQPTLANVTITPAPLTVTGLSGTARTYNATTVDALSGTGSLSGLFNSETLTLGGIANGTLASANAGSEALTSALTLANGTGLASNYVLTQPTLANVTITPAPLTVTGLSGTARTYDATTVDVLSGAGSLVGLIGVETLTLGGIANGTLASANAGSEAVTTAITLANGTGLASNYVLTQPTLPNVTITPAPLTVTGLSGTARTYDGTTIDALSGTASLAGLVGLQTLTLAGATNGALASANAGSQAVTTAITLADGSGLAANYVLTQPTLAIVTITPAPLTVTGLSGAARTYDGTTIDALTGTASLAGLVGLQTLTLGGATNGALASANAGSEAVTTAIILANGSGLASNYVLTQPTLANVTIAPAPLTVTGLSGTDRPYNRGTVDALTGTGLLSGLIGSETLTLVNANDGTLASANAGSEAVTTAIALGNATGSASNYVLTQPTLTNVTISQAQLTVSGAGAGNKVYDGTAAATLTGMLTGVIAGDVVALIPAGSFASKDAGNGIVVTAADTLTGPAALNYALTQPTGLTANITPLAITVNATGVNKVYDGNVNDAATLASGGVIGNDAVSFIDTSAVFDDKNVGSAKPISVAGISAIGLDAGNYTLTNSSASTSANITKLASVTWVGPTTGGSWSNPANWAGGAIPDLSNVANVVIPTGDNVTFDSSVAGPVNLNQISTGGLTVAGGTLDVATALNLMNYSQSGGTVGGTGSFTVTNSFSQTAGQIAMGSGAVNVSQAVGNLSFASIAGGSITLASAAGAVTLGTLTASGNLAVTAQGGTVTQSVGATLTVDGATALAASNAGVPADISLTNAANTFAQAVSASGAQISLTDADPLILGTVDASADLIVNSYGGLDLGTSTVGGSLTANSGNGNVSQDGSLSVAGTTNILAGTGNVQLANGGNTLLQPVSASGHNVSLTDAGALTLGTVDASGNLTVAAIGALDLGISSVGGNLVANSSNGNVSQDGRLSVSGTSDIIAGTGNIQLTNASNTLLQPVNAAGQNVSLTAAGALTLGMIDASGNLTLASAGALDLGTSTVGGSLMAKSANGNITQEGSLSVTGTSQIFAGSGKIELNNSNNRLVRTVSASGAQVSLIDADPLILGTSATSGNLTVGGTGGLNLGTATVGGNLVANSGNGNVTQNGPLHVTGSTDITAGTGTVQLHNTGNIFQGGVTASGGDIAVSGDGPGLPLGQVVALNSAAGNTPSQLESAQLASNTGVQPGALSLSPTVAVIGVSYPDNPPGDEARADGSASGSGAKSSTTTTIGATGPRLNILKGGVRLPASALGVNL
jgi:hypothetical protein